MDKQVAHFESRPEARERNQAEGVEAVRNIREEAEREMRAKVFANTAMLARTMVEITCDYEYTDYGEDGEPKNIGPIVMRESDMFSPEYYALLEAENYFYEVTGQLSTQLRRNLMLGTLNNPYEKNVA